MSLEESREQAVQRMIAAYGDELLRLCFMYLSDWQLAEDALQETFLKVFRKYDTFAGRSSEKTWLVRIAVNVCKDYLRGNWLRRVDCYGALSEVPVSEAYAQQSKDEAILLAVLELPVKYREVILLYQYWGLETAEIAELLRRPPSTVSTRLRRGRAILKEHLEGAENNG